MNSIANTKNCYGCGVCAAVCPYKIITLTLDEDGFYQPEIVIPEKCIGCGLCLSVCAYANNDLSLEKPEKIEAYAAWSSDEGVRRKCSSGGIGFELGKQLVENGYKACGVRYNVEKTQAEHFIASTAEEFIPAIGSKYIQSYTLDAFLRFNKNEKYLVTGTPCQIDSLRRYFRLKKMEDSVVLMDFFCHSVPSMLMWQKYLKQVEKITGKVTYASWRNKQTGWHDSWAMDIDGEKNVFNSRLSQDDEFYKMFLGDYCSNPACKDACKYKYKSSSADIRIGDLWGKTYQNDEKGVSALVAFTKKGNEIIKAMINCTLIEQPFEVVAEGQMKRNVKKAYVSFVVMRMIKSKRDFSFVWWKMIFKIEGILCLPIRIIKKIRK
ncbi:MAG: Coenzyme F420 hydrogenase/dehydrogenase, beta subunit C-terminal domain [Prevotellaceae bacterium]|jgi:coenzyme F420-reducing hydrogenase beta subunit|nr:Coenzyme F420 hydrogenase/dehydrogenase, beta subunit C-terminal domain [Prevotellaceae bacterium]